MNEHCLNSREVTVAIGGEVLGGVLYAETDSRTEAVKVEEYLNPDPVARLPRTVYSIKLRLNRQPYADIGFSPENVELRYRGITERYSGCSVTEIKCEVLPRSVVEYAVTIEADERSWQNA